MLIWSPHGILRGQGVGMRVLCCCVPASGVQSLGTFLLRHLSGRPHHVDLKSIQNGKLVMEMEEDGTPDDVDDADDDEGLEIEAASDDDEEDEKQWDATEQGWVGGSSP